MRLLWQILLPMRDCRWFQTRYPLVWKDRIWTKFVPIRSIIVYMLVATINSETRICFSKRYNLVATSIISRNILKEPSIEDALARNLSHFVAGRWGGSLEGLERWFEEITIYPRTCSILERDTMADIRISIVERKLRVVWSCDDRIAELYSFVCTVVWRDDFDRVGVCISYCCIYLWLAITTQGKGDVIFWR